jgi:CHAT domain-containing protein
VLQYKGRVLDAVADNVALLRRSVQPRDRAVFEQLAEVATQLSALTYQGAGQLSAAAYRQRVDKLGQQQEALQVQLAKRSSDFRRQVSPVTLAAVRSALPEDAALVEWFRFTVFDPAQLAAPTRRLAHYAAYVLTRHRDPVVIDMGEAELIDSLVSDFRGALSDRRRSDVKARAAALTDKLIGPLRPHLRDYRHWLISPDGSLNLIPVGALLDEWGEYLVQQVEISYLTSGRDLLRFNTRSAAKTAAVVVANPTYGEPASQIFNLQSTIQPQRSADLDRSGLVFNPLPGTAQEAAALKTLLKIDSANLLLGSDATEARLKQLHAPRILHIASHGFFLDEQHLQSPISLTRAHVAPPGENPLLRSGIALAGANQRRSGAEDGILTAMEAAQLDLFGTELVVLSACESGVGEVQNGEGVYGLRRALVLAGAQTQIGSLWQVADEPTRKLMVEYYRLLLQGAGRSSALREAQRTMLAMPGRAHPYFWAGFVAIGNPAPLAESVLNRGLSHLDRARFVSRDAWIPVLEMPAQLVVEHRGSYLQQLGVGQN